MSNSPKAKMSQVSMFSSGQEFANLLVSSDLLLHSWFTISDLRSHSYLNNPILIKVYPYHSNGAIVAFVSSPTCTLQKEMVSSEDLEGSQSPFDFISTKFNPHFSVNKAAITLFASLLNELSDLKEELGSFSPLIITGVSLGGSVASLFTLWLLKDNNKRPTCITFGSPLLGDSGLQAISERPSWNSSFLHVVSNHDPIPRFLISPTNALAGSIPQSCIYNPFGMFLLCSDSDCSCFEEPESVLDIMMEMNLNSQHQDNRFLAFDYEQVLELLKHRVIFKGTSQLFHYSVDQLQAGIDLQLEAIGIGGQTSNMNPLRTKVKKRVEESFAKKRNAIDPGKKLNKMKEAMAWLEWYKKVTLKEGGYYDSFKRSEYRGRDAVKSRQEIVKHQRILNRYWKTKVAEVEEMPQSKKAAFRTRWLYSGQNYRRMVEPLDIAEYYMKSDTDYVNLGRSEHYKKLEEWRKEDNPSGSGNYRRKSVNLTEDSCFWAYVEEAIINSKRLREGSLEEKENATAYLVKFGGYVMNMIWSYSVSSEIFQPQSSFMNWWKDYRQDILSCLSNLPLAFYMENGDYQSYA
ncbi:LOW QUALITY PROTEIN: senescence-associated carboxylesterase 101-like [Solanum tuberosum]|uniref:LOW QUALITY PROTEIN: senescence-associated carboxylesterase 101-like n=1 Tax=Solanum tuberosum TaxID=4113 RepID=UPI00073A2E47|nr:PREDICTED: LOW QUALITY PROTEIN: senescence-associated carboxylesterase 101-like [Solanum tuberosum]